MIQSDTQSEELHVVLGTGPLGQAVVKDLLARGKKVRAVNRSGRAQVPQGARLVEWDLTSPEEARRAMEGASVVYGCFNAPYAMWPELFPLLMKGFLLGLEASGARGVFGDNLYMYGPVKGPLREDLPNAARGPKGVVRGRMAELFLKAHQVGRIRGTIGRASDFFGPGVRLSAAGEQLFGNLVAGRPARILGDPSQPHTYTFIEDFGMALVTLGEHEEALGRVWHVPSAESIPTGAFVELVAKEAGTEPNLKALSAGLHAVLALFDPILRELKETRYQFNSPYVVDHTRFSEVFGADPTPHREAIAKTVAWYRSQLP